MALTLNIELSSGIILDHAYCRIGSLSGDKNLLNITVNTYMDHDAVLSGKGTVQQSGYDFVPSVEDNAPNFIKQGYEYLKTLPEFAGATDILE